ncbi:MAG: NAD(P)-dependent oxidoreductase [Planctomycetes bacterium]|nr:NAD(P)-dependent oxidoreductase [Planctomycetota bacterium]
MKMLITGGTGFIGCRLALSAIGEGHAVRVFTQANNPAEEANAKLLQDQGVEVVLGSVTDIDAVRRAVDGVVVVFHLAAAQHEANVGDQRFWDVNVTGTKNLLEAAADAGVPRFVHGSTIGVYGGTKGVTVHDDSPTTPTNIYGTTKLEAENVVRGYRDRLSCVIVRISETYGPGDGRLLKLFRGVKRGKFFLVGDGSNLHHPIYIDDLIEGLMRSARIDNAVGQTFVLAGPSPTATRDMVAATAAALEMRAPTRRFPMALFWWTAIGMEQTLGRIGIQPPLHRRRLNFFILSFAFSGEDARLAIGFEPQVDFDEGAKRTAHWYAEEGLLN